MVSEGWCRNAESAGHILTQLKKSAFQGLYNGILDREYELSSGGAKMYLNIVYSGKPPTPQEQRSALNFAERMIRLWEVKPEFRKFVASTIHQALVDSSEPITEDLKKYLTLDGKF